MAVAIFCILMLFEQSLPVAFGAETAKWICVGAIDITQISVAGISFLSIFNINISLNIYFFPDIMSEFALLYSIMIWWLQGICSGLVNHTMP